MTTNHPRTARATTTPFDDDSARWAAVVARDSNADGRFFYSVRTTGVYCRPSCAARLPRRENVAFHATPNDAERAGFRPCKRCRPAPAVAEEPARYATGACTLGTVLVATNGRGVCAILLGDRDDDLTGQLHARFPDAEPAAGHPGVARALAATVAFLDEPARGLDLPLDIRGSAFQLEVWEALRRIPAGATASYGEIAHRIGRPRAVRAVAQACAANMLAAAIPCHRVVRSDGALSGYRWGVARKRALLAREAAI